MTDLYLGIDFGTSGVRAMAIDGDDQVVGEFRVALPEPLVAGPVCEMPAQAWLDGLHQVMAGIAEQVPAGSIRTIAIDGTSGTTIVTNEVGEPLAAGMMYNDNRSREQADRVAAVAPVDCAALGPSSSLSKAMFMLKRGNAKQAACIVHQADYALAELSGELGHSDENNSLKLGYDPVTRSWPEWISELKIKPEWLPQVHIPGTPITPVMDEWIDKYQLASDCRMVAGTTDSTAAVIATGANKPGDAVTCLGSTLVMKVISDRPIVSPEHGVYSHRWGDLWIVGGASNSGGAVLKRYFDQDKLNELTAQLNPDRETGLSYYPLLTTGERFPVADPNFPPRLTPRPADDAMFLQAMLEGMARIEATAYQLLHQLGAPLPNSVRSTGGGSANEAWTRIRGQLMEVPMLKPDHPEAAFGAARLARQGAA